MSTRAAGVALRRLAEHPDAERFTATHGAVLVAMGWHSVGDTDPRCRVAAATIAETALCDADTVARAQRVLERHGVIVRHAAIPRRAIVWRLPLLTGERPRYPQRAGTDYPQRAGSVPATRGFGTRNVREGSLEISSSSPADDVPGAVAPLPPPPDVHSDEDEPERQAWARLAARRATPAQVEWARRYNETSDETAADGLWPPEWSGDVRADVAFALAALNGWP